MRQRKSREHPRHPSQAFSYHVSGSEKWSPRCSSLLLLCFRSVAHVSHVAHVAQNEAGVSGVWLKNKTEAWVGLRWIFGQGCQCFWHVVALKFDVGSPTLEPKFAHQYLPKCMGSLLCALLSHSCAIILLMCELINVQPRAVSPSDAPKAAIASIQTKPKSPEAKPKATYIA